VNILDVALLIVVLVPALVGARRGVLREALALGGLAGGLLVAGSYADDLARRLGEGPEGTGALRLVIFLLLFLLVYAAGWSASRLLARAGGKRGRGPRERAVAAGLGLVRGWLLASLLLIGLILMVPGKPRWLVHSRGLQVLSPGMRLVSRTLPERQGRWLRRRLREIQEAPRPGRGSDRIVT
jgi:uncharacterized membrane protein required for colicin V production